MFGRQRSLRRLGRDLNRCRDYPRKMNTETLASRPEGSNWSVAQHLEHVLMATSRGLRAAKVLVAPPGPGEDSPIVRGATSLRARWLFITGRIPAGRRAPEIVLPSEAPSPEALLERADACLGRLAGLAEGPDRIGRARGAIPHPILGPLTAGGWIRFSEIHLAHHLRILDRALPGRGRMSQRP